MNINAATAPSRNLDLSLRDASTEIVIRPIGPESHVVRHVFPALSFEPAGTTLIAWMDDTPVGHVQVRWRGSVHDHVARQFPRTPEIRRLRVHEDAQRRGVAKRLLNAAEYAAKERNFRSVGLAVGITNGSAIKLYERNGFACASVPPFTSPMGMDSDGNPYSHLVQYMVKYMDVSTRPFTVLP
jgi:GNAT superfamily N-acetyltransferase